MSKEANARYDAKSTKHYGIKFNIKTDADLIAALEAAPNKQALIKEALRAYIEEGEGTHMETFTTIMHAYGFGVSILQARWLTEEEKKEYAEWFAAIGMVGVGGSIPLPELTLRDLPDRESDGAFPGTNNGAWIITEEEAQRYQEINAERVRQAKIAEIQERIDFYRHVIAAGDRQRDLPSEAEARRREKEYNDVVNEGGYGYVPHWVSQEEYDRAKAMIEELSKELETA
jgi:hypothetical protein